jgi:ubiquinone biosynthesis protein
MPLLRLFTIIRVIAKYRLQEFISHEHLPCSARCLLAVFPWFVLPRCPIELNRAQRLRLALEKLGPVFVKFGQLLSTRPDLIPADIAAELCLLQDSVAPFDKQVFIAIVEKSLGDKLENLFAEFGREPLASASVAQVHAAKLKNGRDVIVKVIRPDIEHIIEQDVALMLLIARLIERLLPDGKRLRPIEVVEDYRLTILDELNLQREAANASQLRRNFLPSGNDQTDMLYVPEVYWDYCRTDVMVMERIYGVPVSDIDALKKQNTNFKLLAERGVEIFFTQVFKHNFFHADMHPGNIFVSHKNPAIPQYIAIDVAIVGSLSREDQHYLARNLLAIFNRDYRQVAELHVECGWVPAHTRIADFESAIRMVCEPIFEKPLGEISYGQILVNLFKTARRFEMEVQPSLVLLQKTLLNIEGLGRQLYPQLDLWTTAKPFMERWMRERFHPKTFLQELKRYGPEWAEKFPQVPDLLFQAAEQIRHLDRIAPALQTATRNGREPQNTGFRYDRLCGMVAILAAIYLAFPQFIAGLPQVPATSLVIGGIGLYWLLRR